MKRLLANRRGPMWLVVVVVIGLVVGAGGFALASIPDSGTGVFHACVNKTNGAVRLIDPSQPTAQGGRCTDAESSVTWNQTGPPGSQGPTGATGVQGPAGDQGPPGPAGTGTGVTSFDQIVGLPCTGSFGQGVLAYAVNGTTNVVTLTCATGVKLTVNLSTQIDTRPDCSIFGTVICDPQGPWHEAGSGTVTVSDGVHPASACSVNGGAVPGTLQLQNTCVFPYPTGTVVTITVSGTNYTGLASEQVTLNADTSRTYSFPGTTHNCQGRTDCGT